MKVLAVVLMVCVASTYGQLLGLDFTGLVDSLSNLGPLVDTTVHGLINNLINQLQTSLAGGITLPIGKRALVPHVQNLIQQLQGNLNLSAGSLSSTINNILSQFQSQVSQFLGQLGSPSARSALQKAAVQAKGEITDAFNELLNQALGHLTDIATSLANVGLASILGSLSGKRGLLDTLGLTDAFNNITSTLAGHINNITGSLTDLATGVVGAVQPHFENLQNELINHGLNAAQSLVNTLSGINSSLGK